MTKQVDHDRVNVPFLHQYRGMLILFISGLCWATWDHSTQWRCLWQAHLGKKKKPEISHHIYLLWNHVNDITNTLYPLVSPIFEIATQCFGYLTLRPYRTDTLPVSLHCMPTTPLGNSQCASGVSTYLRVSQRPLWSWMKRKAESNRAA